MGMQYTNKYRMASERSLRRPHEGHASMHDAYSLFASSCTSLREGPILTKSLNKSLWPFAARIAHLLTLSSIGMLLWQEADYTTGRQFTTCGRKRIVQGPRLMGNVSSPSQSHSISPWPRSHSSSMLACTSRSRAYPCCRSSYSHVLPRSTSSTSA